MPGFICVGLDETLPASVFNIATHGAFARYFSIVEDLEIAVNGEVAYMVGGFDHLMTNVLLSIKSRLAARHQLII